MEQELDQGESEQLVQRVAALDIGKAELVACVRVPHPQRAGRRVQEVRTFATTTRSLIALSDWLAEHEVTLVAMEATSDYWKPAFYLLEDDFECWLLNARSVKNVPGRPKTDRLDAVWLSKVVERGMCRPSFVPERPFRQLRDLTRYRRTLVRERTRDKQRVEKTLEDAQIKLSSVVSDLFGVTGRAMLEAMIAGERDPHVLAEMARGSMRRKTTALVEALTGHFAQRPSSQSAIPNPPSPGICSPTRPRTSTISVPTGTTKSIHVDGPAPWFTSSNASPVRKSLSRPQDAPAA